MNSHRRLVNDLLRDQIADIRFSTRMIKSAESTEVIRQEEAYRLTCINQLRSLWAVRHTVTLDRNGWPMEVWGHYRLEECKENPT